MKTRVMHFQEEPVPVKNATLLFHFKFRRGWGSNINGAGWGLHFYNVESKPGGKIILNSLKNTVQKSKKYFVIPEERSAESIKR
jgi:hypothetical protein